MNDEVRGNGRENYEDDSRRGDLTTSCSPRLIAALQRMPTSTQYKQRDNPLKHIGGCSNAVLASLSLVVKKGVMDLKRRENEYKYPFVCCNLTLRTTVVE